MAAATHMKNMDSGSPSRAGDLFQLLRDGTPRTRAELAVTTGLARSTVATRIDALIMSGLVGFSGEAPSSGGRPPSRVAFNPSACVVLAVDVGATPILAALTDLSGQVLVSKHLTQQVTTGPESVLNELINCTRDMMDTAGRKKHELVGIGIGFPGAVEHRTGRPLKPPLMPGWGGFDVVSHLQTAFTVPVLVDNDANTMALGERASYWQQHRDFVFVKVATGIGAGIINNGELQHGSNGTAGDLGHIQVPRGYDVACSCGNFGCLEALASGPAIARSLREMSLDAEDGEDVIRLAAEGNALAVQALRQAGRDIGGVLAGVVSLLNPSAIVIGGHVGGIGEHLVAGIREVVYQRSRPLATSQLRIAISRLGKSAGILGASQMVTQHVLSPAFVEATLRSQPHIKGISVAT